MPTTTPFANLITFSRGSNATVVGPNGLVQWAPSNLLTQSESFDSSAWFKGNTTVTANAAVAPDGSTTADQIAFAAVANANIQPNPAVTVTAGLVYTFSVYVRASAAVSNVNLSLQGSDTLVSIGTDWTRVSMTVTASGGTLSPTLVTRNSVASTIFAWGAQLELGSTATTYNPTTVKNLLGFSEAFDNAAWTKTRASIVTGAQANPVNGLFNAQKLMEDTTASNSHFIVQPGTGIVANTRYVQSVYAKAGERSWLYMTEGNNVTAQAWFDLANGVVGNVTGTGSPAGSITAVGNGWYRCSLAFTPIAAAANVQLRVVTGNNVANYTGDGNSGIYIYGAQLSDSASLDPYVPTPGAAPTSTAYYGPRFDYDPVTRAPRGILIEEQRTNLFTNSEFPNGVSDAPTRGGNVSATTFSLLFGNTGLAINNTGPVTSFAYKTNFTTVVSTTYTLSAFVRMNDGNAPSFASAVTTDSANSFALVIAGSAVIPTTYTVTAMGNGFYRVSATATAGSASVNNGIVKYDTNDSRPFTVSGYQLEAGAFATSYIPTIASTVTRNGDSLFLSGQNFAQWYRQDEGAWYAEFSAFDPSQNGATFTVSDGTSSNRFIGYPASSVQMEVTTGGVLQASLDGGTITTNTNAKVAFAYAVNNLALSLSGGAVVSDTSATIPTVNQSRIGANVGGGSLLNGWFRNLRYIPVRAADFQLQALTT